VREVVQDGLGTGHHHRIRIEAGCLNQVVAGGRHDDGTQLEGDGARGAGLLVQAQGAGVDGFHLDALQHPGGGLFQVGFLLGRVEGNGRAVIVEPEQVDSFPAYLYLDVGNGQRP
jgi:hypothetical protein